MGDQALSHLWLFVAVWPVECQVPLSMGFSWQEYWNGLPFPSPHFMNTIWRKTQEDLGNTEHCWWLATWINSKEFTCGAGGTGDGFEHWVRKIPWRKIATHSSILARKIPWTEEPGGLQSIGSQRIELDSVIDHTCTSIGDTCRNFCINAFSKLVTGIYTKFWQF